MLTSDDIKLLVENFKTRQEAEDDLRRLEERLEGKMDFRHDEVMTKMDAVYKEVLAMRQEQIMDQGAHERMQEEIDSIKSVPVIAHDLKFKK